MSEAPVDSAAAPTCILDKPPTPPRSTPSPTGLDTESKLSRKREREVSLEPPTPTANDADPFIRERKYSGLPLKKNRRVLDPTEEEEETTLPTGGSGSRSVSGSPPETRDDDSVLTSPRREMKRKVRQISRGVEDISWRGPTESLTSEKDGEIAESAVSPPTPPPADVIGPTISQVIPNGKTKGQKLFDKVEEEETPPKTPEESALSRSVPDLKTVGPDMDSPEKKTKTGVADDAGRLRAYSESNEKGLKRKFLERGTSQGPPEENGSTAKQTGEPLKRPRDDSDKDDNPRETKRPSPPPSPTKSPNSLKGFKTSGFIAYASTTSPFASVKGQNIFSSKPSPSIFAAGPTTSQPTSQRPARLAPAFGTPSTFAPTPAKRSGFEAFASSPSPFASFVRVKSPSVQGTTPKLGRAVSPPRSLAGSAFATSPFSSYAGASHIFGLPAQKRQRGGSPNGSSSHSPEGIATPTTGVFGEAEHESDDEGEDEEEAQTFSEKLRAAKDDENENQEGEDKLRLTEQDVMTGEEEEETIHQVRGKLFSLQGNLWKERGMGVLRLNVKQEDGTGARLVMRKDAVYTLLLNVTLFPGMRCTLAQDPRYLRFTAIENGVVTTYNLKMADAKVAQDLLEEIHANIPSS